MNGFNTPGSVTQAYMSNKVIAPFKDDYGGDSSAILHADETLLTHKNNRLKLEAFRLQQVNTRANIASSTTFSAGNQTFNEGKRIRADVEMNQMIQ
jgi:hypothetical protein